MGKRIDTAKTEEAQLHAGEGGTRDDLGYLRSAGPRALPDDPSAAGWTAAAIKRQLYLQPEILFHWLRRLGESQLALAEGVDAYLDGQARGPGAPKVFGSVEEADAAVKSAEAGEGSIVLVPARKGLVSIYLVEGGGLRAAGAQDVPAQHFAKAFPTYREMEEGADSLSEGEIAISADGSGKVAFAQKRGGALVPMAVAGVAGDGYADSEDISKLFA